jgi:hypothetical protein
MNLSSRAHRVASRLLLTTAMSVAAAPSIAADPGSGPVAGFHPITGKWIWKLHSNTCTETLQFRSDGSRAGTSAEEFTEGTYQITPKPSLFGFYRLTETLTVANGKRDCAGDLHVAGDESTTRFVQFSPKIDQLIVCKSESLQACYGPLRRVAE